MIGVKVKRKIYEGKLFSRQSSQKSFQTTQLYDRGKNSSSAALKKIDDNMQIRQSRTCNFFRFSMKKKVILRLSFLCNSQLNDSFGPPFQNNFFPAPTPPPYSCTGTDFLRRQKRLNLLISGWKKATLNIFWGRISGLQVEQCCEQFCAVALWKPLLSNV